MDHEMGRVPRRSSTHDLEKAETTMRGVSPSLVSISTYLLALSYAMPRSKTGSGSAFVRPPGRGTSFQKDRLCPRDLALCEASRVLHESYSSAPSTTRACGLCVLSSSPGARRWSTDYGSYFVLLHGCVVAALVQLYRFDYN